MTSAQFLEFMISVSIQVAILVGITSLICRIVETPRLQCRLWNTCCLLILFMTIAGLVLPHLRVPTPWRQLSPRVVEQVVVIETIAGEIVLVIWSVGLSFTVLLIIREWKRAFRFLKTCRQANENERAVLDLIDDASCHRDSHRANRFVRLLVSRQLGSPFCFQWHSPHLVIPEFLLQLPPDQIKLIVRHEEQGLSEEKDKAILFFGQSASIIALRGRRLLGRGESQNPHSAHPLWERTHLFLPALSVAVWSIWIPLDALASSRSSWSPWPQWSANVLRTFEIPARDFEPYEIGTRLHEISDQPYGK
ncbi:hypothetical protein [Lacunimicrobium album]